MLILSSNLSLVIDFGNLLTSIRQCKPFNWGVSLRKRSKNFYTTSLRKYLGGWVSYSFQGGEEEVKRGKR
jgi:hypothetical protein